MLSSYVAPKYQLWLKWFLTTLSPNVKNTKVLSLLARLCPESLGVWGGQPREQHPTSLDARDDIVPSLIIFVPNLLGLATNITLLLDSNRLLHLCRHGMFFSDLQHRGLGSSQSLITQFELCERDCTNPCDEHCDAVAVLCWHGTSIARQQPTKGHNTELRSRNLI